MQIIQMVMVLEQFSVALQLQMPFLMVTGLVLDLKLQVQLEYIDFTYTDAGTNKSHRFCILHILQQENSINTSQDITVTVTPDSFQRNFSDEFDTDGSPESSKWGYDIGTGNGGWGNK